ncbi:hypothetical protein BDN70DRAFT_877152 [Pholiota conissans]|uniref:Uncharacterized protein n=1 Tax=Pholiota conissans TaxID=109636 RepID=A0A9P6CUQ5_9AGAR|nr:hypothetical protein BDN70DRAFT_877152 [Pholiota conissans]
MAQRIRDTGFVVPPPQTHHVIHHPVLPSIPVPPSVTVPPGTLYSSAPPSVTNPLPPSGAGPSAGPSSGMNSPGTASSSTNSPEKQLKTIPQQQQQQSQQQSQSQDGSQQQAQASGSGGSGQPPASASSPAISSGNTTNTPALSNTSLKRKQAGGDSTSPTVGNNPDQPQKRGPRKRVRAGTTGAG